MKILTHRLDIIALSIAVTLASDSTLAKETCAKVTIGLPKVAVSKSFIEEADARALETKRNRKRLRETQANLTFEPGQRRRDLENAFRNEDALTAIIELENLAGYYYQTGDSARYEQTLTQLEDAVLTGKPVDEFNRSRHASQHMMLLRIYALTEFASESKDRLAKMKSVVDFVKKHTIGYASKAPKEIRGAFARTPIMSLHLNKVVLKVAALEGDVLAVDSAIELLLDKHLSDRSSEQASPDYKQPSDRQEAEARALADEAKLVLTEAQIVKGNLTGKTQYYAEAVQGLKLISDYGVDECNAELVGRAALLRSQALLQNALAERDDGQKRALLGEADEHVQVARRLLEQLHFPSLWSFAHSLSADIYEQLEIWAPNESLKNHYKNLKIRSHELSQSG